MREKMREKRKKKIKIVIYLKLKHIRINLYRRKLIFMCNGPQCDMCNSRNTSMCKKYFKKFKWIM